MYNHPSLIAIMDMVDGYDISRYAYNRFQVHPDKEKPTNTYQSIMGHTFIQRCFVLDNLIPVMNINVIGYLFSFLIWTLFVSHFRKN